MRRQTFNQIYSQADEEESPPPSFATLPPTISITETVDDEEEEAAAGEPAISMRVSPEQSVVFRWSSDRCGDDDIPDAPARAFRRACREPGLRDRAEERAFGCDPIFRARYPP